MLISPPFIPAPVANESDQDFIKRAMVGGEPGNGAFPISHDMGWHGGIHLTAPQAGSSHLPVRAIADGTIAYVRQPLASNSTPSHPLNYGGGWTDNGCLVIKHETEIGEGAQASVVFYSIYMHLSSITLESVHQGLRVYRKDVLGKAGSIYGTPHKIHFEIICGQEQVSRLVGRDAAKLMTTNNGRSDSCWGDMHFYVPPEVLFYAECPEDPRSVTNMSTIVHRPAAAYFVRMNYSQGQCSLTTFNEDGVQQGECREAQDYEYKLYKTATKIYPQSPSAGYELLRFGRILGPDRIQPVDAAHWRQVAYPDGVGWVNLNSATVTFYSDADFPHWLNWRLIDDDTNGDGRCQSRAVMDLLGIAEIPLTSEQRDACNAAVVRPESQEKLSRLICKFPSEWRKSAFDERYGWLLEGESPIVTPESFQKLKAHYEILAFWEEAALENIESEHWHFSPKAFIQAFRTCSWLNLEEFAYTLPKYAVYALTGGNWVANTAGEASVFQVSHARARSRLLLYYSCMNKTMLKYGITTISRRTHFLAQVFHETGRWRTVSEDGSGAPSTGAPMAEYYAAFYGRGIMQLTWASNYEAYGGYRTLDSLPAVVNGSYSDPRITASSTHYWSDPTVRNQLYQIIGVTGIPRRWAPRYDPGQIATDPYNACDSGGFFWVSKVIDRHNNININRQCDKPFDSARIGSVSVLVNGGSYGYHDRQAYAHYIFRYLSDATATSPTALMATPRQSVVVNFSISRPA